MDPSGSACGWVHGGEILRAVHVVRGCMAGGDGLWCRAPWAWCSGLLCGVIAWLERAPGLGSKIRSPAWWVTGLSYHAVLGPGRGDLMALSCWAVWCGFGEGHGSSVVVGGYDLGVGPSCMVAVFLEST